MNKKLLFTIAILFNYFFICLFFHSSSVFAGPQSTTYELMEYGFGAGGEATISSTTYSLLGTIGEMDTASLSSTTFTIGGGLINTLQAAVPPGPTVTNPGSNYDRLHVVVMTGNNPSDTLFALSLSDGITTYYVQNDRTIGTSLGLEDWLPYTGGATVGWGDSSGFDVTNLKNNTTYTVFVKAKQGNFTESGWGPGTTGTTVDPTLTFGLNSAQASLQSWWKMDESAWIDDCSTATVFDSSSLVNSAKACPNGSGPTTTSGIINGAGSFNGSSHYLTVPSVASLQITGDLSVSAWIYRNSAVTQYAVLDYGAPGETQAANHLYILKVNADSTLTLEWEYSTGTNVVVNSSTALSSGASTWTHIAVVRDATTKEVKFYENGNQLGTTQSFSNNADGGTTSYLEIGRDAASLNKYFAGKLDDVRIFNAVLAGTDVSKLYSNTYSPYSITFNSLNSGNSYTDSSQSTVFTTSTNAYNGYIVYGYETQPLTHSVDGSKTIANYAGSNASPTSWSSTGFGYTTSDSSLTGGTADRFTNGGPNYAGFGTSGPGDPVADHAGPVTSPISNEQFTISYRVTASSSTTAGEYRTNVVYVAVPTY